MKQTCLFFSFVLLLMGVAEFSVSAWEGNISRPELRHQSPSPTAESPYRGTANFGKSIAVFGGSLSENKEFDAAKQIRAKVYLFTPHFLHSETMK